MKGSIGDSLMKRSIWWALEFDKLVIKHSELLDLIPDDATVCIMPSTDPEVSSYNVNLAVRSKDQPIVFVHLQKEDDDAYTVIPYLAERRYEHLTH